MRTPTRSKTRRGAIAQSTSIPAPVGGWNARDSVAQMDPLDALIMLNWFPETNDVRVRKGYSQHVTGISGQVESLMVYNKIDGTQTMFAAANSAFYNVTSSGAVGAAVQSGLSNNRWYETNFTNSSGTSYLCCFNGVDSPRYWDGSSWTTITGASTPAITGVTTTTLIFPFVHKRRMFLIQKDTLDLWYIPVDSVGGAASKFSLAGIADKGGYLVAGGTWTIDGGSGVDDYLVAITSEGQVIVYAGTNPASDYTLQGVYNLGEPLGRRCLIKYRGDMLIALREGVYPLSAALMGTQLSPESALTFKISKAMTTAGNNYIANFGWQPIFYPAANMLLFNVPVSEGANQQQYVMNTITGAWGQFKGIGANCWAILDGDIYFGGDNYVGQFWDTDADNGSNIDADLKQAFNYLGAMGPVKQIKMIRPNFLSTGVPTVRAGVNTDFRDENLTGTLNFSIGSVGVWGTSTWGNAVWGSGLDRVANWSNANAIGNAIAPRIKTAHMNIELRYAACDILFEIGTVL